MGKGKLGKSGGSLVEDDFKQMAAKWEMTVAETKKNVYALLKKQIDKSDKASK
jgi:hypothetical protein